MEDGWQHSPARSDQIKVHTSPVPYDELPDSEKDYDRVMVEQVIKAAVAARLPYRRFARPADATGTGRAAVGHWLARLEQRHYAVVSCSDSHLPATGVVRTALL